jgi:hypothetical protein
LKLKDKVCIVTGGAKGIGEGIVSVFSKYGAKVMIFGKSKDALDKTVAKYKKDDNTVVGYHVDVRDNDKVRELVGQIAKEYGQIDVLVNNAGVIKLTPFEETDIETRDYHIDINIKGAWNVTHAAVPFMKKGSAIVNLSSVTGPLVADTGEVAYAMTKSAMQGFTKGLAADLVSKGIRVNCIQPGFVLTPLVKDMAVDSNPEDPDSVLRDMASSIPMGRLGDIEEVGELAAFLGCDESSYITGQGIVIDGGSTMPETGGSMGV